MISRVAIYLQRLVLNTVRWLFFGLYNSIVAQDPRFLFASFCSQRLPLTTTLPHPVGVVISSDSSIGENVSILQNVTIGGNGNRIAPRIGDNVTIHSGAVVVGDIDIGDGAVIGANSVVLSDVPPDTTVVGTPARIVGDT
jgi:serine O-acetyltransferase